MSDPFGAPAPRATRGGAGGREYIDPAGIRRDRWDRPILPHPETGEVRAWTSVTTLAGTLADRYHLEQWKLRQVARGMGLRRDLAALAAATDPEDRATLQRIASDAMEAAGSSAGRNMGSALHEETRRFDQADQLGKVRIVKAARPDVAADLKAYAQTMEAYQLQVIPDLMERMTVCLATESAGTFDRLVLCSDGVYRVADLKTGQRADEYGFYEAAQQFAQYANGEALWRVTDQATAAGVWEPMPGDYIDRTLGILIWLPAGQARCEILYVDLAKGAEACATARTVREQRKAAKSWVVPAPPPPPAGGAPEVLTALADDVAPAVREDTHADEHATAEREAQLAAIGVQALDELLLTRVKGARDRASLMDMARQHAESWSPALQAAAAKRWEELPA